MNDVILEFCKRTNPQYQDIRNRHYIPNKGTHGQQIHFLIHFEGEIVGIISGASSVYAVKARDNFFEIPSDKQVKQSLYLPAIVNNTVFRLEKHYKNLGTKVLSKFRKVIAYLWEEIYNIPVIGFETFVIETDYRKGSVYRADNWSYVGQTFGNTKTHKGLNTPSKRNQAERKMIYCKWVKNKPIKPTVPYKSSWKAETKEERGRAKQINKFKKECLGSKF